MFLGGVHEQQNNCLSNFYLRKGKEKEATRMGIKTEEKKTISTLLLQS